jgi:hypothetical protein
MKTIGRVRRWLVGCGVVAAVAVEVVWGADGPVVEKPPQAPAAQPYCEAGFTPIFNGKDLDDWVYGTKDNEMKKGAGYQVDASQGIVFCTKKDGGNLYTKKEYANFILRLEFKVEENGNNGIGIRSPLEGRSSYVGMEIQVLDDYGSQYTKLKATQYTGSVYDVFAPEFGYEKRAGEWNEEEIMADGRRIRVILNSHVITDCNLDDVKDEKKLKTHPGLGNKTGHIGFLGHGARVEFRNLRIKELAG